MGWKGLVRSLAAGERQAARERQRLANHAARVESKAESILGKLSNEIEMDMRRVVAFEEKLARKPVDSLDLQFDVGTGWRAEPFTNNTGVLTFTLQPHFASLPVHFNPDVVDLGDCRLTPLACTVTSYATFVAFSAITDRSSLRLTLVKPTQPEDSRLLLVGQDGVVRAPLDCSLKGTLLAGTEVTGVVAFEPFEEAVHGFKVACLPKKQSKTDDPEPEMIEIGGETLLDDISRGLNSPGYADLFLEKANEARDGLANQLNRSVRQAKSASCMRNVGALLVYALFFYLLWWIWKAVTK